MLLEWNERMDSCKRFPWFLNGQMQDIFEVVGEVNLSDGKTQSHHYRIYPFAQSRSELSNRSNRFQIVFQSEEWNPSRDTSFLKVFLFWESRKFLNYLDDFLKKKPDRINEYIIWNVAGKFPNRVHVSKPSPWPQFVPANRQVCQRRKWTEVSYKGGDTVTSPQNCSSSSKSIPFE